MAGENVVQIVVKADNATGPGFDAAKASSEAAAEGMDTYAASVDKAAEAQAQFDAAQKEQAGAAEELASLQKDEAAGVDELTAAQERLTGASIASADARKQLASAEADVAAKTKVASDEQVASGLKAEESGGVMAGVGSKVKGAFLGIAVGAGYAIDSAMKYDEQSTALVTGAGELDKNLGMVKKGMLDISTATATSLSQVNAGMYMIESAGYHGAAGLTVLKAAAEGAKVGNADLGTVADATTTVLTDYKMSANQATSATSGLVATVAAGKTHLADLSSSLSKVLPTASALKIPFDQIGGAMATMTAQGVTARLAATHLNSTLIAMANPSKVASTAMSTVGLTSQQVTNTLQHQGLTAALQEVTDAAGKKFPVGSADYIASVDKMLGGSAGLAVALQLTGSHLKDLKTNTESVAASMKSGSGDVQGWNEVQGDAAFRLEKTKQAAENTAVSFGEALMPAVTDILGPLSTFLGFIAQSSAASTALAAVIGGVLAVYLGSKLVNAFSDVGEAGGKLLSFFIADEEGMASNAAKTVAWIGEHAVAAASFIAENIAMAASATAAFIAENAATLGLVAGIGLLVAGIIYMATHWKQSWGDIKTAALDAWHFIDNGVIHPIEHGIGDLVSWIESHWKLLATILATVLLGPVGGLVVFLATHWNTVRKDVSSLVNDVVSFFRALPGRIVAALSNLSSMLFNVGVHVAEGFIRGIASMGGAVAGAGLHMVESLGSAAIHFLGIGSPSKLAHWWGEMVAQGLSDGITANAHKPARSALQMATGLSAGFSAGTGGAAGAGAAGGSGQITLQIQAGGSGSGLDGLFMQWLKNNVRVSGGDPRIFNKKVMFI